MSAPLSPKYSFIANISRLLQCHSHHENNIAYGSKVNVTLFQQMSIILHGVSKPWKKKEIHKEINKLKKELKIGHKNINNGE
jgi:hypothetical protein